MAIKICYIWVEQFRNFENFGFNISSSYKFQYDSFNNKLSSTKVDSLPSDFFGENITDVVGIIGKNGSGKSNAIELICKVLKGAKSSINTDFLFVVEDNSKLECFYSFQNRNKPISKLNIQFREYIDSINPLKVVFFSNVFDERRNEFDKEVTDISVNNLHRRNAFIRKDRTSDFEKQIRLINSKIFTLLKIDLPTKVQLTSKIWINRYNLFLERNIYNESFETIKEFKRIFRDRLREIRLESKFIHLLRFGFFFETFNNYFGINRHGNNDSKYLLKNLDDFISSLFNLRTEEISEKMMYFLKEVFLNLPFSHFSLLSENKNIKESEIIHENFKKQIDFLINLKFYTSEIKFEYHIEGSRNKSLEYFTFAYNYNISNNFINEYITLFSQSSFFEINWLGISSGHKAYLNLFSSLYQELRYTRQSNLLLCIDEGDLYLHPMWQIEFFDKLITVLPKIYSGKIQLILTSHSPFLLSDLPKQNITILNKDGIGSSIDGIDLKNNTFGGNLYDLYSEPFFLDKKRTSDFAYNKIKKVIESVENKDFLKYDKITLLKISNLIGDEIIQFQIQKLLKND